MTVGELIAELQKHPADMLVVIDIGYDAHTTTNVTVKVVNFTLGEDDVPAGQDVLWIR